MSSQPRMALTIAGPKDLVGLMLQPSIGSSSTCDRKTAKPIAMQAFL